MTDTIAELRERHLAMADKAIADDSDHLDAPGPNDMAWLIAQLACWPTRVDPSCTTNSRFLMVSAAHSLRSLLDRVEAGEVWRKHYFDMAKAAGDLKAAIRPQLDAMTFADHAEVRKAFNDIAIVAGRALDHMQGSMKPPQQKADTP